MSYICADFQAVAADCDENIPTGTDPLAAAEYLANLKACAVAEKFPDDIVIGCDTTVVYDGEILGKPADKCQCTAVLDLLSGRTHQVVTGCSVMHGEKVVSFSEVTNVTFRELSSEEIEAYASTNEPYDKAGGYGIQGLGSELVYNIEGDFFNVVGLPVTRLYQELKKFMRTIKE